MRRYVTISRYSEDLGEECTDIGMTHTIYEPDSNPRPIGLLDINGNELFAVNEMDVIGFVRFRADHRGR